MAIVSEYLTVIRSSFPDCWRSYRKSTFADTELSFSNTTLILFGNGWSKGRENVAA